MKRIVSVFVTSALIGGTLALTAPLLRGQQTNSAPGIPNSERFPDMRAALQDLEKAKNHLNEARHHEFGGHREAALKSVDEAIKEIRAGIKFAAEKH